MNRPNSIPRLRLARLWAGDYGKALLRGLLLALILIGAPLLAGARSTAPAAGTMPKAVVAVGEAAFDYNPMTFLKANPTITGSASSTVPLHFLAVASGGAVAYDDPALWVQSGHFAETIYPPIANGTYMLSVLMGSTTLATSTLTVGLRTQASVESDDSLASYDVADGHLMRFKITAHGGRGVEVSQMAFSIATNNASVADLALYAYTDPNFSVPLVASSTDPLNVTPVEVDATTSIATLVPDQPIEIPAGSTYYFDLTGTVAPSDTSYDVATTLLTDTNPHFAVYADLASTSNFVWSPDTYGTTSLDTHDWTNGALVGGIPKEGLVVVRTNPPPTDAPACSIQASTSTAPQGTPVTLTWSTTGATSAVWDNGVREALFGFRTYTLGSTTHTYILNVSGPYGQGNCFATVVVPQAGTVATTIATTTDGFTATPTSGPITLAVTFTGSVNNSKSCAAQTFSLGYGNGATSTISVPANLCKAQSFSFVRNYTTAGTSTAGLYKGTGTSSAQRIQTQVIVAKAKVAFNGNGTSNLASVLSAVGGSIGGWLSKLFSFFKW